MDGFGSVPGPASGAPEVTMGPRTTATSATEGRLKVDAGAKKGKKAILKRRIKKVLEK